MNIPPEFWKSLSDDEYMEICKSGALNRRLCRRLWAINGRTDKPPHKIFVVVNKDDLLREFPEIEKKH